MADINLTPIPYNNGALQVGLHQTHYCMMSQTQILNVVAQTNPNYVYAWVTNITNLASGTFSSSIPKMRAVLHATSTPAAPSSIAGLRVFRLTADSALLVVNGTACVLKIDGTGDIALMKATATVSTYQSPYNSATNSYAYPSSSTEAAVGSYWQVFPVRDNVVYVADRMNNNYLSLTLRKLTYDPIADTLTFATIANGFYNSGTINTGPYSYSRHYLVGIPGTTKNLFYSKINPAGANNSANANGAYVCYAAILDATNDAQTALDLPAQFIQSMVALTPTTILGFTSNKAYLTRTNGTWNTTPAVFCPNGGTGAVWHAEALDANYFALWTASFSAGSDITSQSQQFGLAMRIGRFVDAGFGQTSTNTSTGEGLGVSVPSPLFDQQSIARVSSELFLTFGRVQGTNTTPVIRTMYQPGG